MTRMFTTCPACRMNLAVTAMDLRVGQGYVRCGRCERVFNALVSLAEDIDADQQSGHAATGTTSVPALDDPELAPEPAMEPQPEWAAITPIQQPLPPEEQVDVVDSQATGTVETIVLEGDGYLQTEEHVDEQEVDEQLQQIARQISDSADEPPADTGIEVVEGEAPELEPLPGDRPRTHWAWGAAAALLALLLGGQMVHHTRQRLVAHPWLQQPLQSLYGAFGVTLEPAWDLKAYDLRQLGGAALPDDAGSIVLRATVHNRAPHAQPPPLIRAVLQDRFGNALTTTAISPAEYLRGTPPARMAPDQRLDVQLKLPDPTRQAVGFELDACLTATNGALRCSHDR